MIQNTISLSWVACTGHMKCDMSDRCCLHFEKVASDGGKQSTAEPREFGSAF